MLARLVLALMIGLFAVPAAAMPACHAAPVVPMMHHGMTPRHDPAQPGPVAEHCLGCIAPVTVRAPALAPPLGLVWSADAPARMTGISRLSQPPATPPPRFEA